MKPLPFFAVAAQQVTTHAVHVLKLEGQFLGATADRYLQVHDSAVVAAEGSVPLKQWVIQQTSPFFQTFSAGELALTKGLYICVSNTDGTKTLSADTMDLAVELTDPEQPSGTTYVGDLVTAVASLSVWNDAAGPLHLMSLEVDGTGLGADAYIMLFAKDAPANGDKPIDQFKIKAGQVLTGVNALRFGTNGRAMQSVDNTGVHDGCQVKISTTTGVLTAIAGTPVKIKGEYRTL
jgi:hypothetical protein